MDKTYHVRAVKDTIVSSGPRAGMRTVSVVFAGCNMWSGNPAERAAGAGACARWCDTDFARAMSAELTAEAIAENCSDEWGYTGEVRRVVLTGGEPLLHVDRHLIMVLQDHGFEIAVETNGTVLPDGMDDLSNHFEYVSICPKLKADGTFPDLKVWAGHELKVELGATEGRPQWTPAMLDELARDGDWKVMSVQPVDPIDERIIEVSHLRGGYHHPAALEQAVGVCLEWVRSHPDWRVTLQMEKVLNL